MGRGFEGVEGVMKVTQYQPAVSTKRTAAGGQQ